MEERNTNGAHALLVGSGVVPVKLPVHTHASGTVGVAEKLQLKLGEKALRAPRGCERHELQTHALAIFSPLRRGTHDLDTCVPARTACHV